MQPFGVLVEGDYACEKYYHCSSQQSQYKAHEHQQRVENCSRGNLWQNQVVCRVYTHHLHGIDLLGDPHASNFGSNIGSDFAGKDKGYHSGTELQYQALAGHIAYIHFWDKGAFDVAGGLYYNNSSNEYRYHCNYRDGVDYQLLGIGKKLFAENPGFVWLGKYNFH